MDLRVRLFKSKQQALKKNPNLFISETRLCIRNIPKKFKESDVRTIIEHYLEEWKHTLSHEFRTAHNLKTKKIVHQVKLLKDPDHFEKGEEKQKGMGFVELEFPESALYVVRQANNLKVSERARGLILEFAIEDHRTLLKRRQRYEKRMQQQEEKKKELKEQKREKRQRRLKEKVLDAREETADPTIDGLTADELKGVLTKTKSRGKKQRIKKKIAAVSGEDAEMRPRKQKKELKDLIQKREGRKERQPRKRNAEEAEIAAEGKRRR